MLRLNVSAIIILPFLFSATAGHIQTFTGQEVRDLLPRSLVPSLDQRATVLADSFQNGILKENENVRLLYHQKSTVKPFEDLEDSVQIIMKWNLYKTTN